MTGCNQPQTHPDYNSIIQNTQAYLLNPDSTRYIKSIGNLQNPKSYSYQALCDLSPSKLENTSIQIDYKRKKFQSYMATLKRSSLFQKIYRRICPCVHHDASASNAIEDTKVNMTAGNCTEQFEQQFKDLPKPTHKKRSPPKNQSRKYQETTPQETDVKPPNSKIIQSAIHKRAKIDEILLTRRLTNPDGNKQALPSWPINNLQQNVLINVSSGKGHNLLAYISYVNLKASALALEKTQASKQTSFYSNDKTETFWGRRYLGFQKFDNGIKLDENGWMQAVPEAVAAYIGEKIAKNEAKTILDACSGGSCVLGLARSSSKVYVYDSDPKLAEYVFDNACVYGLQNIALVHEDFLKAQDTFKADTVFLHPKNYKSSKLIPSFFFDSESKTNTVPFNDLVYPNISAAIKKSLETCGNFHLLLPYNTEPESIIETLVPIISNSGLKYQSSTSIQIQKIYFMNRLQYLLISYGTHQQIKLSDELERMYLLLVGKHNPESAVRKLVKELREYLGLCKVYQWCVKAVRSEEPPLVYLQNELIKKSPEFNTNGPLKSKIQNILNQLKNKNRDSVNTERTQSYTSDQDALQDRQDSYYDLRRNRSQRNTHKEQDIKELHLSMEASNVIFKGRSTIQHKR